MLGQQQTEIVLLVPPFVFQKPIHVVPTRGELAFGIISIESVYDCARFVAFEGVVAVVYIAVKHFGSFGRIAANHVEVGVACPYQIYHIIECLELTI